VATVAVEQKAAGGDWLADILRRYSLWLIAIALLLLSVNDFESLVGRYFYRQDGPALIVSGLALAGLTFVSWRVPALPRLSPLAAALVFAASALLFARAGWWLVFHDYPFSRDEYLADFDSLIFLKGHLIGPIPPQWQAWSPAMMSMLMLEVPSETGWASSYLPLNAAIRTLMDLLIGRDWTSPALAAVALLALHQVARRLWPERNRLQLLIILLLALSPQFLTMAMTPFAMTAHLALNLLWLWCFLKDSRRSDLLALLIGFLATGLHQLVFHPLFVFPFILELALARRWSRAAFYGGGYLLIALLWASYWSIGLAVSGLALPVSQSGAGGEPIILARVIKVLSANDITALPLMALNLLRFVAWQHILLVPLALLSWPAIRRGEGIARPLALGMASILLLALVLIPSQGVGWGYRYLHGYLGSAALLAGYGWLRIADSLAEGRQRLLMAGTSAATALILLPFLLAQTYRQVEPNRKADSFLAAQQVPFVLVDPSGMSFGNEYVRNAPDLSNRPLRFDLELLRDDQVRSLCAAGPVPLFDIRHGRALKVDEEHHPVPQRRLLRALHCGTPLPLPNPSS
jgi:hypothetical protein